MRLIAVLGLLVSLESVSAESCFAQRYVPRASGDRPVMLSDVATRSTRIARVQVLSRLPLWLGAPEQSPSCGAVYRVKVIDSLKGSSDPFEFFSANANNFKGSDRDYLVFVFERSDTERKQLTALEASMSQIEYDTLMCRLRSNYYSALQYQTMISFDPVATKQFGGDWLAPANRADLTWCVNFDHPRNGPIWKQVLSGRSSYEVLSWVGAKSLIDKSLKAREFIDMAC